jgi:hypothetical protein
MECIEDADAQTRALRETLESILRDVNASSPTTPYERVALDEKRHRVDELLSTLPHTGLANAHPSLVSPQRKEIHRTGASWWSSDARTNRESQTVESVDVLPLPRHRLLGNVFARPPPPDSLSHVLGTAENDKENERKAQRTAPHILCKRVATRPVSPPRLHGSVNEEWDVAPTHRSPECRAAVRERSYGCREEAGMSDSSSRCHSSRETGSYEDCELVAGPQGRQIAVVGGSPSPPRRNVRLYDYACVTPSFWINVWPCFGNAVCRTLRPTRVLVRGCYRFFEDVVERAAAQTRCQPACPALYTPDGCPVRELDMLVAEQHYLLFPCGGFYRRHAVPTALLWLLYADARHLVQCA